MVRALISLILLVCLAAVCWFAFPPAKALATQTLALRAADRAEQAGNWVDVANQLKPLVEKEPHQIDTNLRYANALIKLEANKPKRSKRSDDMPEAETYDSPQAVYMRLWQHHPGNLKVGTAYADFLSQQSLHSNPSTAQTRPLGLSILRELLQKHPNNPAVTEALAKLFTHASKDTRYDKHTRNWLTHWAAYYWHTTSKLTKSQSAQLPSRIKAANAYEQLAQQTTDSPHFYLVEAGRQYCQALLTKPTHVKSRFNLGLTLMNLSAAEAGVAQMQTAIDLLINNNQVTKAQQLNEEAQRLKTSLYYSDPDKRLTATQADSYLGQCLQDQRLAISGIAASVIKPADKA